MYICELLLRCMLAFLSHHDLRVTRSRKGRACLCRCHDNLARKHCFKSSQAKPPAWTSSQNTHEQSISALTVCSIPSHLSIATSIIRKSHQLKLDFLHSHPALRCDDAKHLQSAVDGQNRCLIQNEHGSSDPIEKNRNLGR